MICLLNSLYRCEKYCPATITFKTRSSQDNIGISEISEVDMTRMLCQFCKAFVNKNDIF